MKELFEIIRALCAGAAGIKMSDRDNGQLDEDNSGLTYPCALIKLSFPVTETIMPKVQQCKGTVQVTVAFDLAMIETSSLAPQAASDRSLQYMDYGQSVYAALQGYDTAPIISLDRTLQQDVNKNGKQCVVMVFSCDFLDRSAEG